MDIPRNKAEREERLVAMGLKSLVYVREVLAALNAKIRRSDTGDLAYVRLWQTALTFHLNARIAGRRVAPAPSMPTPQEEHAAHLIRSLAYPVAGSESMTSPPVVDQVSFEFPAGGRASFHLTFTNGLVLAGALADLTVTNPRVE